MFRRSRERSGAGTQFCDSCVEVTTAEQRAQRRIDAVRAAHAAMSGPR